MKLTKIFNINQLAIRTFSVFWIAFFAMMTLIVIMPYFDLRIYTPLKESEVINYQKRIMDTIRNKQLSNLLVEAPVLPTDKYNPLSSCFSQFTDPKYIR